MHALRLPIVAVLAASLLFVLTGCTASANSTPLMSNGVSTQTPAEDGTIGPDCPQSIHCVVIPAALIKATATGAGACNYSPLGKATSRWHASGVVIHTTEGSMESALTEVQTDTKTCVSWNYLVAPDGTIYENVPPGNQVFSVNNRFFNTDYIQIEHVGYAEKCDITGAAYKASAKLVAYLGTRYGFRVNAATVIGHDSVPGINDKIQATQHWDPGACWNWRKYLTLANATSLKSRPGSGVIQITSGDTAGLNAVALHTGPNASSPLVSDPYLHKAGSAGTTKASDWGDTATVGHTYVVTEHQSGWTGIWYGGQQAWFKGTGARSREVSVQTVTPNFAGVPVYGRPMPSADEFEASDLPTAVVKAQNLPARLTRYSMDVGQSYVLASSSVRNQFFEGCDETDCSGPFDGTLVTGKTKYLMIEWNHRFAYVKASDVKING